MVEDLIEVVDVIDVFIVFFEMNNKCFVSEFILLGYFYI